MKQCPKCENMVTEQTNTCSYCGYQFSSANSHKDSEHEILYKEAIASFSKGRYNEAMDYALGALALMPENNEYNKFRLQIIKKQQEKQKSKELFEAAILAFRNNNLPIAKSLLSEALALFPGKKYLQLKHEIEQAELNSGFGEEQLLQNIKQLFHAGELKEAISILHDARIEHPSCGSDLWVQMTKQLIADTSKQVTQHVRNREYKAAEDELSELKSILPNCKEIATLGTLISKKRRRRKRKNVFITLFIVLLIGATVGLFFYLDYMKETDKAVWEIAKKENTINAYRKFILNNPQSAYLGNANQALTHLLEGEKIFWNKVTLENSANSYEEHLKRYIGGEYENQARHLLDSSRWVEAINTNTPESYKKYIHLLPEGEMKEEARYRMDQLEAKIPTKEEVMRVDSIFSLYFSAIEKKSFNEALELFPITTKQYFNLTQAPKDQVLEKMKNIWKADIKTIRFSMDSESSTLEKMENGDLKVSFNLNVNIERDDAQKENYEHSLIIAEITPESKINYITSKKISGY